MQQRMSSRALDSEPQGRLFSRPTPRSHFAVTSTHSVFPCSRIAAIENQKTACTGSVIPSTARTLPMKRRRRTRSSSLGQAAFRDHPQVEPTLTSHCSLFSLTFTLSLSLSLSIYHTHKHTQPHGHRSTRTRTSLRARTHIYTTRKPQCADTGLR